MWEQLELNFTAPTKGELESELTRINDDQAYLADTSMGYKILNRECERCNSQADTDSIPHYRWQDGNLIRGH